MCLDRRIEYIRHKGWKESSSGVIETKGYSVPVGNFTSVAADEYNGIIHRAGNSVKVTTSSSTHSVVPVEQIRSANWNLQLPDEGNDAWVQVEFTNGVCVESYAIKKLPDSDAPWFWQLEGSNDGTSWQLLDSRSQTISDDIETFECTGWTYTFFRFIRFRQTLDTCRGKALNLNGLEFYGKIQSSKICNQSNSSCDDVTSSSSDSS